ncbi:MAG: hypothetical protein IKH66_02110, partial [Campylobacter sp.]|nr:hypothetical protein [Campylobacter sp.]
DGYYCPICKSKMIYDYHHFSHVGKYRCSKCDFSRPEPEYAITQIDLEKLPNRTVDAVSYGLIKSVILLIKDFAKDRKIYFTGGDGHYLSQFFSNSIYDRNLIFRSMLNLLKQKDIK